MKKLFFLAIVFMSSVTYLSSQSSETLPINNQLSHIKWTCDYAFYFGGHEGFINFEKGFFKKASNGTIIGGEFIINMNTIKSTDMDNAEARLGLDEHLKDPDFFNVSKYPSAMLKITRVKYHDANHMKLFADLTIKDVTIPINFQAEVNYDKKTLKTRFKIDRTRWGITYNSKEVEGKLKDGLISDAIGFEVEIRL